MRYLLIISLIILNICVYFISGCVTTKATSPDGTTTVTIAPDQHQIEFWIDIYREYKAEADKARAEDRVIAAQEWQYKVDTALEIIHSLGGEI